MAEYHSGAVCRRGHPLTGRLEWYEDPQPSRCVTCGSEILYSCASCGYRIRGGTVGIAHKYNPPDFCERCGAPHPWLSRQGRIFLLQNLLDESDLPAAERLRAREQLDALIDPELADEEQARHWARFKKVAPAVWAGDQAQRIVGTLLEAGTRAMIEKYAP